MHDNLVIPRSHRRQLLSLSVGQTGDNETGKFVSCLIKPSYGGCFTTLFLLLSFFVVVERRYARHIT